MGRKGAAMRTSHVICVPLLGSILAGCGIAAQMQAEQHNKDLIAQMNNDLAACKARFGAIEQKTFLDRVRCLNDAMAIGLPAMPDQDLVSAYMAERIVIAEQVQAGKMTLDEGVATITARWSQVSDQSDSHLHTFPGVGDDDLQLRNAWDKLDLSCDKGG
jgi:hypothetical protein